MRRILRFAERLRQVGDLPHGPHALGWEPKGKERISCGHGHSAKHPGESRQHSGWWPFLSPQPLTDTYV